MEERMDAEMKLPLKVDLREKVSVITGAGGVLCGTFARALAASGAKGL